MLYNYNFVITTIIFITSFLHHFSVPNMTHMGMLGVLRAYVRTNKQTKTPPSNLDLGKYVLETQPVFHLKHTNTLTLFFKLNQIKSDPFLTAKGQQKHYP